MELKKRTRQDSLPPAKKKKFHDDLPAPKNIEEIHASRQLSQLLAFQQDGVPKLRYGLQSFKAFLEAILYGNEESNATVKQAILKEYIDSQTPRKKDIDANVLPDVMQTWSFASHGNHDNLLSTVPAVLALLLRCISTQINLREFGLSLCRTLLQQTQLKLIARGLGSPKHKDYLISPCLRLLTEIVSFDGGSLAPKLFAARSFTFDMKVLARNLALSASTEGAQFSARHYDSVRTNTVRYITTCIKLLPIAAKAEIAKYGGMFRSLFDHTKNDSPQLLKEIFTIVRAEILTESKISRVNKVHILNESTLSNLALLYRTQDSETKSSPDHKDCAQLAHEFLLFVCTDASAGILRPGTGWYPAGAADSDSIVEDEDHHNEIDLGLDSIEWYNNFSSHVPVKNGALAGFIQSLRPYANAYESELLVSIFRAAPELVADYFFKKSNFSFDPKLTATWMGYSAFLLSTIRLPVPAYFGNVDGYGHKPPPVSVVAENMLPQPLSQKVLTRCLNQPNELITFFSIRLLVVAFEKLRQTLEKMKMAEQRHGSLWRQAAEALSSTFTARCPKMKDIVTAYRKMASHDSIQSEVSLRLLNLYFEVTPQVALEEKVEVSMPLIESLKQYEHNDSALETLAPERTEDSTGRLRLIQSTHLVSLANKSPDMRWWQKPDSSKLSPIGAVLRLVVLYPSSAVPRQMRELCGSVFWRDGILQQKTERSAPNVLFASLQPSEEWRPSETLFAFLDDAFGRLVRKPIKYLDDLDELTAGDESMSPVSLLSMVLLEQWPFAVLREEAQNVYDWLQRYLRASEVIGEDPSVLNKVKNRLESQTNHAQKDLIVRAETSTIATALERLESLQITSSSTTNSEDLPQSGKVDVNIDLNRLAPPQEDDKHTGLHQWSQKSIDEAVNDGDISALILCLSSQYPEVRTLALSNLHSCMKKLDAAQGTYPEAKQLYLLIGILTSTVTSLVIGHSPSSSGVPETSVPYTVTAYASLATSRLAQPLNPLYPKLARFHTRSPKWDISRLPTYWIRSLLFSAPSDLVSTTNSGSGSANSEYWHEAHFLLQYLHSALRTPADLDIFRQRNVFEPLLALLTNPFCTKKARQGVLGIVWRATCIEGGSTTLITRSGIVAWLAALVEQGADAPGADEGTRRRSGRDAELRDEEEEQVRRISSVAGLRKLAARLWETCDQKRVQVWSQGDVKKTLMDIADGDVME